MACRRLIVCLVICLLWPTTGRADNDQSLLTKDFGTIVEQARGTTVNFFMWGGSARINRWVDRFVAPELKRKYDLRLRRTPMDAAVFINKLLTEKAAGKTKGTIDLLWINGENFKKAVEADLLFGPFSGRLPNYHKYVDPESVAFDFGFPVKEREAPYGRAQFVFEYDSARTPNPPRTMPDLLKWSKAHSGRFTYPQPPDFTGSAFTRQVFYVVTGGYEQYMAGFNPELFRANAPKLWAFLNELKPYLWQKGRAYPRDSAALDTLFARGEVDFSMSYHPPHAQSKILDRAYPATVRTMVMADGSLFNTHFTTIPFNAPNKAGAMVTADFLLSPQAQLSKFDPRNWGDFPAVDLNRLPRDWRARFRAVDLGPATLTPEQLAPRAVPEIPADYVEALEAGWDKHVLR